MLRSISLITLLCSCGISHASITNFLNENDVVQVISTSLTGDDRFHYQTFEIDVPESDNFYMEFWGLPAKLINGQYSEYSIFLDNELVGKVIPKIGNWQSIEFDSRFYIPKGNHTLSIGTPGPEIPMIETVRISKNKNGAFICHDEYDDYLYYSRKGESFDHLLNSCFLQSQEISNSNENTVVEVPLIYTFYHTFYLTKGEEVFMKSESASDHIMDVFFYGYPKYSGLSRSHVLDSNFVVIDTIVKPDPIVPHPKKYNQLYQPASVREIQGLNWKFISERSLNSASQSISGYVRVPMTGYYMVRITSATLLNTGTSFSCPHVAGVTALILQRNPLLTVSQVRGIIASSAVKIGDKPYDVWKSGTIWNQYYGFGLVDACAAIMMTPRK